MAPLDIQIPQYCSEAFVVMVGLRGTAVPRVYKRMRSLAAARLTQLASGAASVQAQSPQAAFCGGSCGVKIV